MLHYVFLVIDRIVNAFECFLQKGFIDTDVIEQFDLTWDLYASTGDELAAVMPKEFAKFLV